MAERHDFSANTRTAVALRTGYRCSFTERLLARLLSFRGNPRLPVKWNARQESDPRGLRSERTRDANNPHLNKLAGQ
jgi:hypothetical protein